MQKGILVFSGFNTRAVIAFIRTLEKNNVLYGIIAKSNIDDIFQTDYAKKVVAIRDTIQLNLKDILNSIEKAKFNLRCNEYIIAPSTEALNRFILEHIDSFEDKLEPMGHIRWNVSPQAHVLCSEYPSLGLASSAIY